MHKELIVRWQKILLNLHFKPCFQDAGTKPQDKPANGKQIKNKQK